MVSLNYIQCDQSQDGVNIPVAQLTGETTCHTEGRKSQSHNKLVTCLSEMLASALCDTLGKKTSLF